MLSCVLQECSKCQDFVEGLVKGHCAACDASLHTSLKRKKDCSVTESYNTSFHHLQELFPAQEWSLEALAEEWSPQALMTATSQLLPGALATELSSNQLSIGTLAANQFSESLAMNYSNQNTSVITPPLTMPKKKQKIQNPNDFTWRCCKFCKINENNFYSILCTHCSSNLTIGNCTQCKRSTVIEKTKQTCTNCYCEDNFSEQLVIDVDKRVRVSYDVYLESLSCDSSIGDETQSISDGITVKHVESHRVPVTLSV